MNPESNGEGKTRLDRIEAMLERFARDNEAAHQQFRQDHKLLLTAQVVMQDALTTLTVKMSGDRLKVDALIKVQDEWIRNNPRGPER